MEHEHQVEKQRGATCNVRLARLYIVHSVLLTVAVTWLVATVG